MFYIKFITFTEESAGCMVAQTQVIYWCVHYQEGLNKHWSNLDQPRLLEERTNILCSLDKEYSCNSVYWLLLQSLQGGYIEENENF